MSRKNKSDYVSLLTIPSFSILLIGRIVSGFGQILFTMATMWYILQFTNSALSAAIVPLLPYLTYAFFGIPLSTISDRMNKKKILISTDLIRSFIALIVTILFLVDSISPWQIYVSNLLIAIFGFLFNPAIQTVLPSILPDPKKQLAPANALLNASSRSMDLIGYAVGGIFISFLSTSTILMIYSLTFLLSALSFLFIKIPKIKIVKQKGLIGFYKDSLEGVSFLFSKKILKYCILFGAIINFAGAPLHIFTPIYSKLILHAGSKGYGLLESAFTAGSIVGALFSGKFSDQLKLWHWFVISFIIAGSSLILMPLFPSIYIGMSLSFVLMFGLSLINVPLITSIVLVTPEEKRGRVMNSMGVLLSGISNPLGLLLGGWLIEVTSAYTVYICIGSFIACMGIISLLIKEFRDSSELRVPTESHVVSK